MTRFGDQTDTSGDRIDRRDLLHAAALIAGGVALTLVYMFVVVPLKSGHLPGDMGGLFVIGFLLNAAWGIGWALFLALLERLRGKAA